MGASCELQCIAAAEYFQSAGIGGHMAKFGSYRIQLEREWSLEDLYVFPRAFEQVYFFYSSVDQNLTKEDQERILHAYSSYPWQGGYSAVSFFNELKSATRKQGRPKIAAIHKCLSGNILILMNHL